MTVKYPSLNLKLVGEDGNAFAILGRAQKLMRRANLTKEEIDAFSAEATSGDYNKLLQTCMAWFDTTGGEEEDDDQQDMCVCCGLQEAHGNSEYCEECESYSTEEDDGEKFYGER